MASKRTVAVLLLDKNSFTFFGSNIQNVLKVELPITIVRDLEVINSEQLYQYIKAFIQANKILPGNVLLVLSSSLLFEKVFQDAQDSQQENTKVQEFLENVPFVNINTKVVKLEKGYKVVVVNRDLYLEIKNAFESEGFKVEAVVPAFLMGVDPRVTMLDVNLGQFLIKKIGFAKQNTFLTSEPLLNSEYQPQKQSKSKEEKLRLYGLIGVFLVLLIILIIVIITTFILPAQENKVTLPETSSATKNP